MENMDSKSKNLEDVNHLETVKYWVLNAAEKIKEEQERVNNPWYACFNTVLHVVHGNLELASYEEHVLSQEKYEKSSALVLEVINEAKGVSLEISDDKKAELLEKLKHILD